MTPATPVPSTKAGMIRLTRFCPGSSVMGTNPDEGSQPRVTENSRIIMMPSQKCGTEIPDSAIMFAASPTKLSRRVAATMPSGTPMASATIIERIESSIVTGSLVAIRSSTEIWLR